MAKTPKSAIEADLVRTLANLLEETGLSEIEYGKDGLNIRVAKAKVAPRVTEELAQEPIIKSPPAPTPAVTQEQDEFSFLNHPGLVKSPMVGVVYTAPEPGSKPFIKVGEQVVEGQTLFLIEAMKVFNPIKSPKTGKVTRILIEPEVPVEFDEPLAIIE